MLFAQIGQCAFKARNAARAARRRILRLVEALLRGTGAFGKHPIDRFKAFGGHMEAPTLRG